jgi:hypothetical protein
MNVAIAAGEPGTAILTFDRDAQDHINVSRIDRLPAGLDPAVDWLARAFPDFPVIGDAARVVVDTEGLGQALWARLRVGDQDGWTLYEKRGRDRQELVNALLVATSEGRIHISPSPHGEALRKALLSYHKVIADDGIIGGELVSALALAIIPPEPVYEPFAMWA